MLVANSELDYSSTAAIIETTSTDSGSSSSNISHT